MLRQFHSLSGLIATILVMVLSISGVLLSVQPALERTATPAAGELTVAALAQKVADNYTGVESIQRTPSGTITVYFSNDQGSGEEKIDPQTGIAIGSTDSSAIITWVTELHRSLFLGDKGRAVVGIAAVLLLMLSLSGIWLMVARLGGWLALFGPVRGSLTNRRHCSLGRFVVLALLLTSLTGSYLSAVRFNLLPAGDAGFPDFPMQVDGGIPVDVSHLSALDNIKVTELQELVYPYMDDPADFYSVTTDTGVGYVDQVTGEMLAFQEHSTAYKLYELIYRLHTGEGFWWLGLILGVASLNLPVICITSVLMWWRRRSALPKLASNYAVKSADTLILVGSEGNNTWGFAKVLHDQLTAIGYRVRTTEMNQLERNYPKVEQLFILTSTFGDGKAPTSAKSFLKKLEQFSGSPQLSFAVLGFGDRQFPLFGQYAKDVNSALAAKGFISQVPLTLVDRQSAQEFTRWGRGVGKWLSHELAISYTPKQPTRFQLELLDRVDYGLEIQAPTSVFRFQYPIQKGLLSQLINRSPFAGFEAGDFIGIYAPKIQVPRFYSLASGSRDGILEICVRKQEGGVCSNYLHGLTPGDCIEGFIKPNPTFKPKSGKAPVILIGAGTGIGPLAGFIRQNSAHRPLYLYWGGRDPQSDFIYQTALQDYLADNRLTELNTAFSRISNGCYVQDELMAQGPKVVDLLSQDAQVMICGGRNMANEVEVAINKLLAPLARSVAELRAVGDYLEDVY
ncbi:MAG: PepSY domain-containing protein [Psychromonas sp.]